jgi:hydroxymethylbilane synthase
VIRLGTRGSALALAQAHWVAERLPGEVEVVPITTSGDERQPSRGSDPLEGLTDKSRFVKEIEQALLAGDLDLGVHSAKDVPSELPSGLVIQAVPERADPRDAICGADSLEALREGAVVGTASLRRRSALLALRPDLDVRELRGNVDTRLRRLAEGNFDAIVLARAGLERLGRSEEGMPIEADVIVPAPGQGCLLIEARDGDDAAVAAVSGFTDIAANTCLIAERSLVRRLDASCHTPIGAHAVQNGESLTLTAFVGLPDGSQWIRDELGGAAAEPAALGAAAGERLLAAGAGDLLAEAERVAFAP